MASTSEFALDAYANTYDQLNELKEEQRRSEPAVSKKQSPARFRDEYKDNKGFAVKIDDLCNKYDAVRRTAKDGNCFFRGFFFSLLEWLASPVRIVCINAYPQ